MKRVILSLSATRRVAGADFACTTRRHVMKLMRKLLAERRGDTGHGTFRDIGSTTMSARADGRLQYCFDGQVDILKVIPIATIITGRPRNTDDTEHY